MAILGFSWVLGTFTFIYASAVPQGSAEVEDRAQTVQQHVPGGCRSRFAGSPGGADRRR